MRRRTANRRRRRQEQREVAFVILVGKAMEQAAVEFIRATLEGAIDRFMCRVVPEMQAMATLGRMRDWPD
jgi:hypothetical protein